MTLKGFSNACKGLVGMDPTVPTVGASLAICPIFDPNFCRHAIQMAALHSQVPLQHLSYVISFLIAASETHHIYNESYLWHVSQVKGWAGLCNQAQQQFLIDR